MDLISAALEYFSIRQSDDYTLNTIDRFSSKWMGIWIVICLVLSTAEPYVGRPIECWPNEEYSSYSGYILEFCYLQNTRYVYPGDKTHDYEQSKVIAYYPWVNLILIALLVIYIIPTLIFVALNRQMDISPHKLAEISAKYNISEKAEKREKSITEITSSISSYLSNGAVSGVRNRLAATYISVKLLNVVFNILAIVFLCVVFGKGYLFFSAKFLHQVLHYHTLENDVFPLHTFCDFKLIVANNQDKPTEFTEACLLSTNLFLIFIFASTNVLQVIVLVSTIVDFFVMVQKLSYNGRVKFIKQQLKGSPYNYNFISVVDVLSLDGVLILQLLSSNVNTLVVSEVVKHMCLVDSRTRIQQLPEAETEYEAEENGQGGNDEEEKN